MTRGDRDSRLEDRARRLFEEARRGEPAPPAFETLWARAAQSAERRRPRPLRPFTVLAAAAVSVLAAIVFWPTPSSPPATPDELYELAVTLPSRETPLDFLLATPGRDLIETVPGLSSPPPLFQETERSPS